MMLDYPAMPCPSCGEPMTVTYEDLHYTECGLPYVYLKNIRTERCACGEVLRAIPKTKELHRTIALELIKKKDPLVSFEITYLRKSLGMSKVDLAQKLHVTKNMPTRWEKEKDSVPMSPQSDLLLRALVAMNYRITSYIDVMDGLNLKNVRPHVHRDLNFELGEKGWHAEDLAAA